MKCIIKQVINIFGITNREFILLDITEDGKGVISNQIAWDEAKDYIHEDKMLKVLSTEEGCIWAPVEFKDFVFEHPNLKEILITQIEKVE